MYIILNGHFLVRLPTQLANQSQAGTLSTTFQLPPGWEVLHIADLLIYVAPLGMLVKGLHLISTYTQRGWNHWTIKQAFLQQIYTHHTLSSRSLRPGWHLTRGSWQRISLYQKPILISSNIECVPTLDRVQQSTKSRWRFHSLNETLPNRTPHRALDTHQ